MPLLTYWCLVGWRLGWHGNALEINVQPCGDPKGVKRARNSMLRPGSRLWHSANNPRGEDGTVVVAFVQAQSSGRHRM